MKNLYLKIISSALIALCIPLLTCGNFETDNPGMVWIPPGTFLMGSNDPGVSQYTLVVETPHEVTLTKGFWMSRYAITQEQFFLIMKQEPTNISYGSRHPAEKLSWYTAIVFCNKMSIKEGLSPVYSISRNELPPYDENMSTNPDDWGDISVWDISPTGPPVRIPQEVFDRWDAVEANWSANGYRLPTEAEWEYACRAGTTKAYNFFDKASGTWGSDTILPNQANYGQAYGTPSGTSPVGTFPPNKWGLYDMHGNVCEWCWDWYGEDFYKDPAASHDDPVGPDSPSISPKCVLRGGSWWDRSEADLRSASRICCGPEATNITTGFRVVRQ